jgi:hypothetical protein
MRVVQNLILSVRRRSRVRAALIAFNHWWWILKVLCILSGSSITLPPWRFHIRFQATDTKMANSLPFSGRIGAFSDLNLARFHPRTKPQLSVGHCVYFFDQSCCVRFQISFWPGASHYKALCSRLSEILQAWHCPRIYIYIYKPILSFFSIARNRTSSVCEYSTTNLRFFCSGFNLLSDIRIGNQGSQLVTDQAFYAGTL